MAGTLNLSSVAPASDTNNGTSDTVQAMDVINAFVPWLLIITGCTCNIFIILGMRTKHFRSLSTSVYMIVGAYNDLFALPIALVAHWVYTNYPEGITRAEGADFMCKFFQFYGWGQADVGIVVTTAMTADRAYVILKPMTTKDLVKRAKIVIAVVIFVVVVKEFHFLITSGIVDESVKERLCDVFPPTESYEQFYRKAWPWIHALFLAACFVIMVTSNSVIIHHVRTNRQQQVITTSNSVNNMSPSANSDCDDDLGNPPQNEAKIHRSASTMTIHSSNYRKVTLQVTRMLLAESFTLILLTFPFSVHLIVSSYDYELDPDSEKRRVNGLVFSIVFYLLYANKCVNFLVYCMAGQRFRKAILDDVLKLRRCRNGDAYTWTGSGSSLRELNRRDQPRF